MDKVQSNLRKLIEEMDNVLWSPQFILKVKTRTQVFHKTWGLDVPPTSAREEIHMCTYNERGQIGTFCLLQHQVNTICFCFLVVVLNSDLQMSMHSVWAIDTFFDAPQLIKTSPY